MPAPRARSSTEISARDRSPSSCSAVARIAASRSSPVGRAGRRPRAMAARPDRNAGMWRTLDGVAPRGGEQVTGPRGAPRSDSAGLQRGELLLDAALVLVLVLLGLLRAPAAGHHEDERDEEELSGHADPPPALPLVRAVLLGLGDLAAVRGEVGQVIGRDGGVRVGEDGAV